MLGMGYSATFYVGAIGAFRGISSVGYKFIVAVCFWHSYSKEYKAKKAFK